jgi:two-component system chemotaxis response regulator CheV
MSSIIDEVSQRANLALSNQMEMLTFYLSDDQLYGINVFKIIEMVESPRTFSRVPMSHPSIMGVIDFRGKPITVIDLSMAIELEPINPEQDISYIIICEYNTMIHGFLVKRPEQLLTRGWDEIKRPTGLLTLSSSLVAIAYGPDGEAIQLLDIEKVLAEVLGMEHKVSADNPELLAQSVAGSTVLVVDDSRTARSLICMVLDQMGITAVALDSAPKALSYLGRLVETDDVASIGMVISDVEMPDMDGFTFTRKLKADPALAGLHVMLHTSMSNPSNKQKADQVGANDFLSKFSPDELVRRVTAALSRE